MSFTSTCPTCQTTFTRPAWQDVSDALWACDTAHREGDQVAVVQLPTVDWHRQALDAILALAVSGKPFVISQVIEYGVPDAPRPRTDWPKVQGEAQALGWITPTGRLGHSVRPTTKGSPCTEWEGTVGAQHAAARRRSVA